MQKERRIGARETFPHGRKSPAQFGRENGESLRLNGRPCLRIIPVVHCSNYSCMRLTRVRQVCGILAGRKREERREGEKKGRRYSHTGYRGHKACQWTTILAI